MFSNETYAAPSRTMQQMFAAVTGTSSLAFLIVDAGVAILMEKVRRSGSGWRSWSDVPIGAYCLSRVGRRQPSTPECSGVVLRWQKRKRKILSSSKVEISRDRHIRLKQAIYRWKRSACIIIAFIAADWVTHLFPTFLCRKLFRFIFHVYAGHSGVFFAP